MAAGGAGVSALLASAFSSTLGSSVVTYEQYCKRGKDEYFRVLNIDQLFQVSHLYGKFGDCKATRPPNVLSFDININTLAGTSLTLNVTQNVTVRKLKESIEDHEGIPINQQRLIFDGRQLEDSHILGHYNIQEGSTLHLVLRLCGGGLPTYYVDDSIMDPTFDYDFTQVSDDGVKYYKGGYEYQRPYGWKRYAIKVLGRFENDNWLGQRGQREYSSNGEWPVSYHGTGESVSGNIAQDGYQLSKGKRFMYGKGIYSTPSIEVAAKYAKEFSHKGKQYKIVFQNRVSPTDLKILDAKVTGAGEYWVQPHEELIRPYGIIMYSDVLTSSNSYYYQQ